MADLRQKCAAFKEANVKLLNENEILRDERLEMANELERSREHFERETQKIKAQIERCYATGGPSQTSNAGKRDSSSNSRLDDNTEFIRMQELLKREIASNEDLRRKLISAHNHPGGAELRQSIAFERRSNLESQIIEKEVNLHAGL